MQENIAIIIEDIKLNLDKNVDISSIKYFTDGVSGSTVFCLNDKYLVKTMDELELKAQVTFLSIYTNIDEFAKLLYTNEFLGFAVFEFVDGVLFKYKSNVKIVETLYSIVSRYSLFSYDYYGYLYEDEKSWYEFLKDETTNEIDILQSDNLSNDKLKDALLFIKNEKIPKYLLHGDFGAHNFMIDKNNSLKVIDPMPVVGDRLYDFYFAIFSSIEIFKDLSIEYILSFFDENINHKRNILIVALYIRMIRAYKYNRDDFDIYYDWFKKI